MGKSERRRVVLAKKTSVVATEIALALLAARFAYAQEPLVAEPPAPAAEKVERIEVTGSRLPQLNTEGPSPITTLNAQDIKFDGYVKTEDLLNQLPQVLTGQGSNASNGANGTAQVNLRNLGVNRNLVLVNGRRLPPGSPRSISEDYAADLNQIPAPLIQRVELLTGGASAVYGSDAISGVVNFIMNDRFEGIQIDWDHGFYNHQQHSPYSQVVSQSALVNPSQFSVPGDVSDDGHSNNISVLLGRNFADNRGNATIFFNYRKEKAVVQSARDFSACALDAGPPVTCGGSSTAFPGRFIAGLGANDPGADLTVADAAGNPRGFTDADLFNFGPFNYFRRPSEQYGFSAFLHLDVAPRTRVYSEFGFHDNQTVAQVAPSGVFLGQPEFLAANGNAIHFENPLLTDAWRQAIAAAQVAPFAAPGDTADMLIGRRNLEGGTRQDDLRHTSYRGVLGMKGNVWQHWNYDLFGQHGKVLYQNTFRNDFSKTRIARALDVVTNPATGQPACRAAVPDPTTGVIVDPDCVPYDIWRLGGVTQGALDYVTTPGLQNGRTEQTVFGGTLSADLGNYQIKLPTATNGIGVVVGVERRKEKLVLETDAAFTNDDLSGQGGATIGTSGSLDVDEIFGEVRVPLIEERPFADVLSVNGSYRHSDYSTNKKTDTYGVGAEWAPVRNYRFRSSYQHAVRHANITELFQAQGTNLFDMNEDPCSARMAADGTPLPPRATLEQCLRTGLDPARYNTDLDNPAGQYNFLQGGEETLDPEKADSYTLGLVFTPIRNLTGTIDWWRIKIAEAIDNPPPLSLLNACINTGQFCDLIERNPALGTLWGGSTGRVVAINDNIGGYDATGIDIAVNYNHRLGGLGTLGFSFLGTYVDKWEFEPLQGLGKFDCAGLYGPQCSDGRGPNPKWRHKFRTTWATPWNVELAATWRHIDKVKHEGTTDDPLLAGDIPPLDRELAARDYLDLAGAWTINKVFTLRAGVNNVFDKDPPIVSNTAAGPSIFGNGNTFPQIYDALGRFVFASLVIKL